MTSLRRPRAILSEISLSGKGKGLLQGSATAVATALLVSTMVEARMVVSVRVVGARMVVVDVWVTRTRVWRVAMPLAVECLVAVTVGVVACAVFVTVVVALPQSEVEVRKQAGDGRLVAGGLFVCLFVVRGAYSSSLLLAWAFPVGHEQRCNCRCTGFALSRFAFWIR